MKNSEIRELSTKDLEEKLENAQTTLHQMKINHSITPLENPSQLRTMRHDIARMKTELHQRELNK